MFADSSTTIFGTEYTELCSITTMMPKISIPDSVWATQDFATLEADNWPTRIAVCSKKGYSSLRSGVRAIDLIQTLRDEEGWRQVTVLGEAGALTASKSTGTGAASGEVAKQTGSAATRTGTEGSKSMSTQTAGAAEVTAWVNAVVVVAAAAAFAI